MTTLQLRRLRAYNAAGWNDCQIADELGLTVGTVYYWRRLKLGLPTVMQVTNGFGTIRSMTDTEMWRPLAQPESAP